jgi:hypothetical protein
MDSNLLTLDNLKTAQLVSAASVVKALFTTSDGGKTPANVVGCDLNVYMETTVLP